jgi:hypothetical protein
MIRFIAKLKPTYIRAHVTFTVEGLLIFKTILIPKP